jgi:hypothetical protein
MHGSRFRFQVPVPVSLYRCIAVSLFSSSRHLLIISLSQTVRARNQIEKLANMPEKRKCKEPSKSAKRKCRRRSVVRDGNTSKVEGHASCILAPPPPPPPPRPPPPPLASLRRQCLMMCCVHINYNEFS